MWTDRLECHWVYERALPHGPFRCYARFATARDRRTHVQQHIQRALNRLRYKVTQPRAEPSVARHRDWQIWARARAGQSYRQIGAAVGLSATRVMQIDRARTARMTRGYFGPERWGTRAMWVRAMEAVGG